MNNYEEIKFLLEASRQALNKNTISEVKHIKKSHGLILEEPSENFEKYENEDSEKQKMFGQENLKNTDKRTFKIKGNTISIHGKSKGDLQLTLDEKTAFQESIDEFRTGVAELVDFNVLNVYDNNVEWSGMINNMNMEFFFSVLETDGVYIKGDMIKVDKNFNDTSDKLKKYYDKFKSKWSKIIATRKEIIK